MKHRKYSFENDLNSDISKLYFSHCENFLKCNNCQNEPKKTEYDDRIAQMCFRASICKKNNNRKYCHLYQKINLLYYIRK